MKLPLSWIKEFIEMDLPSHQIAKLLTLAGLEVESFKPLPLNFEKVVVGEVIATEKHPEADKLCVAKVSDGTETYQVVCGASNCRKGIKTAFALVGASLTDEEGKSFKVKKSKLRGVESNGMLCSEMELGLGTLHEGIMEFADHLQPGTDVAEIYADTIFDIALTPNLGHCASVIGISRELSAATGVEVCYPAVSFKEESAHPADRYASVVIEDIEKCPRYSCRVIRNVRIGPSPEWLQKRLLASDLRPINNIVDITNYVMLEMGHPLHAFDYDLLEGHKIIVRRAVEGEKFETLDHKERVLCADDLLICDAKRPAAIAGVMGGLNSEVTDQTKNILLESAYFSPTSIRRTSKRLGLQSESSRRFERGADAGQVLRALDRAAMLIADIAGGEVCAGVIDKGQKETLAKRIPCRLSRINQVLGTKLSLGEVENIFQKLDIAFTWDTHDQFVTMPPSYRVDLNEEVDLIEEVARIYGFDNIPKDHTRYATSTLPHSPIFTFEREIRSRLLGAGLQEVITCDLIGPTILDIVKENSMPPEASIKILNPTSIEQSILRTSLLPGLLQVAKHNYDNEVHDLSGFEIGRIHFKEGDQYKEQSVAGIFLTGQSSPYHWESKSKEADFYDLKGIIENLLRELGIGGASFKSSPLPIFHPGRSASVYIESLKIGSFGEVHPAIQRRLDIPQRLLFAEIDLHDLIKLQKQEQKMKELPLYPCSTRDLTITTPEEIAVQEILDVVQSIPSRLLEEVSVQDIYRSDKVGTQKKNVTLHFIYRDLKKTVAQEAVEAEHARITAQIESRIRR